MLGILSKLPRIQTSVFNLLNLYGQHFILIGQFILGNFWEGIIRGWWKPWQCVNLTMFISFKSKQASFYVGLFSLDAVRFRCLEQAFTPPNPSILSSCSWKAKLARWLWPCLPDKFLNSNHLYESACAYWIWWKTTQILRMGLAVMPPVSRPDTLGM